MPSKPRVYLDSCCYIDVAKGRAGVPFNKKGEEDRAEDLWYLETLLTAAFNGDIEIYASALVIAECLHTDDRNAIPDNVKDTFKMLLTSGSAVKLIAVDFFVSERARDLLWNDGIFCGGAADQIHVATALEAKCEEFITTNRKRGPLQGDLPEKLARLRLRVIMPGQTASIPPAYQKPLLKVAETTNQPSASTVPEPPSEQSRDDEPTKA